MNGTEQNTKPNVLGGNPAAQEITAANAMPNTVPNKVLSTTENSIVNSGVQNNGAESHERTLFRQAVRFHQQGQFAAAIRCYRQLLDSPQITSVNGQTAKVQTAKVQTAQTTNSQNSNGQNSNSQSGAEHAPSIPPPHTLRYNLGVALIQNRQIRQGLDILLALLDEFPNNTMYLNSIGSAYAELNQYDAALDHLRRSWAIDADNEAVRLNLYQVLVSTGQFEEALRLVDLAIERTTDHTKLSKLYTQRAHALRELARLAEAEADYLHAIELSAEFYEPYMELSILYAQQQKLEASLTAAEQALQRAPGNAECHLHYGNALYLVRKNYSAALAAFDRGLQINPHYATAHYNKSLIYRDCNQLQKAMQSLDQALALDANNPEYLTGKATLLMHLQQFEPGLPLFEHRFRTAALRQGHNHPDCSLWQGEPLAGKSILVQCEQGLGDSLQFCRFIPLLIAQGAQVHIGAPLALVRILATIPGIGQVYNKITPDLKFDYYCYLLSLPLLLKIFDPKKFAAFDFPYLHPLPPSDLSPSQAPSIDSPKLPNLPNPTNSTKLPDSPNLFDRLNSPKSTDATPRQRVGIFWSGAARATASAMWMNRQRSIAFEQILPLLEYEGVDWVILQRDERPESLTELAAAHGWYDPFADETFRKSSDLYDTAQIMGGLSGIIGVDSALIHLAGALDLPIWLLNRFNTCWRWGDGQGQHNSWYPKLREFRQPLLGDWRSVIHAVRRVLQSEGIAAPNSRK